MRLPSQGFLLLTMTHPIAAIGLRVAVHLILSVSVKVFSPSVIRFKITAVIETEELIEKFNTLTNDARNSPGRQRYGFDVFFFRLMRDDFVLQVQHSELSVCKTREHNVRTEINTSFRKHTTIALLTAGSRCLGRTPSRSGVVAVDGQRVRR